MKPAVFSLFLILAFSTLSQAQDYKRFRTGLGAGYFMGGASEGGVLIYLEPAYRIQDKISLAMRLEIAAGVWHPSSSSGFVASYSLNGQYYFSNGDFRPFAGMGFGLFTASDMATMCDCSSTYSRNVPGFYPRLGFEYGHFAFNIEYNFLTGIKRTTTSIIPGPEPHSPSTEFINRNYFSTKIGFTIGGGRKK